jgi:origin recognition complex subunit 2
MQAPAKKPGRPRKAEISISKMKRAKEKTRADENESEDEGDAFAVAPVETHKRKRDEFDFNNEQSGSEDDEDNKPVQQEASEGDKARSSKRKSAMDLVSGRLDEEMLKKMARDLAQEPRRLEAARKVQSALVQLEGHKWRFLMTRGGHSLLFYGFGSKMGLLESFAKDVLTDGIVLAIHGYRPTIHAKHALHAVASVAVPEGSSIKGLSSSDLLRSIHLHQSQPSAPRIYLLVHNIDGAGLRSTSDQALLAELSRCPR